MTFIRRNTFVNESRDSLRLLRFPRRDALVLQMMLWERILLSVVLVGLFSFFSFGYLQSHFEQVSVEATRNHALPIRIYDAFAFNDEFDYLEVRLLTLASVVHRFVVVEENMTFQGKPKPLFLTEALKMRSRPTISSFEDRIRIVRSGSRLDNSWENEYASRNAFRAGLSDAREEDWVLMSDLDEIPKPDILIGVASIVEKTASRKSWGFECSLFYYSYKWKREIPFGMPVLYRKSELGHPMQTYWRKADHRVPGSCWHCSNCFGPSRAEAVKKMIRKALSGAHTEFAGPPWTSKEFMRGHLENGTSPFFKTTVFEPAVPELEAPPVVLRERKFAYVLGRYDVDPL